MHSETTHQSPQKHQVLTRRLGILSVRALSLVLASGCTGLLAADLPSPWRHDEIHPAGRSASAAYDAGSFTLRTEAVPGTGVGGKADAFDYIDQPYDGNFEIVAKVTPCTVPEEGPCAAGLMVRESLSAASRNAFIYRKGSTSPSGRIETTYRTWDGERTRVGAVLSGSASVGYVKMVRYGDAITTYASADGASWRWVSGVTLIGLPSRVFVGMALGGVSSGAAAEATFSEVTLKPPVLAYTTSWFGNSLPGGTASIPQDIVALYWDPNSDKLLVNSFWDEAGREAAFFDASGRLLGSLDATHGYGRLGGFAITSGAGYVYMSMEQQHQDSWGYPEDPNMVWFAVRRYEPDGSPSPLPGGEGYDGSLRVVSRVPKKTDRAIRGLAWDDAVSRLYVSDTMANSIRLYDADLESLGTFHARPPIARPRALAVDRRDGTLWIVAGPASESKILHYAPGGAELPGRIAVAGWKPQGIATDPNGWVWVADDGPDQQVKIFKPNGTPARTLGDRGGIYSGVAGKVGPSKLAGPMGIAVDGSGNVYVAGDILWGTDLRKFDRSGSLVFSKYGLEFLDTADADPATDGADVYTKLHHYRMDYSKPQGEEWTYVGVSLDAFAYPDDLRLRHHDVAKTGGVMVRRKDGRRFMFLAPIHGFPLGIYRFDGEIAVPCGVIATYWHANPIWPPNLPKGWIRWIWTDKNGNGQMDDPGEYEKDSPPLGHTYGWYVDDNLDIWTAASATKPGLPDVRRYRAELDPNRPAACPVYRTENVDDYSKGVQFDPNGEIESVTRALYVPGTDTMFLGAYTKARPKDPNAPGFALAGSEIRRYENWTGRDPNLPSRVLAWKSDIPYEPKHVVRTMSRAAKSIALAGDRIFAVMQDTADVYVYDAGTGAPLPGERMRPGPEVAGKSGFIDLPLGINAYRRSNGEYIVFAEEDWQAKGIMYRLNIRRVAR